jgi:Fic family protein
MVVGARRVLRAEVEGAVGGGHTDASAKEILANIEAMDWAISQVSTGSKITLQLLLEVNRRLLVETELSSSGGKLREEQNWIGGSDFNPCSADFVPPEWESVEALMEDLVDFSNQNDLPAVAQAALAHSQFETVHPFVDGNGRTGRVLIQMILRRRGLSPNVVPPVSLILATQAKDYVEGLGATRYSGEPDSKDAINGINLWVGRFAAACVRSVGDAMEYENAAKAIQDKWREEFQKVRAGSSLDKLLSGLVGMPILTVSTAMKLTGSSHQKTSVAVSKLVEAGVLKRMSSGMRNVSYEAPEIFEAFTSLERQLGSPSGNTKISPPSRSVPARVAH